MAVKGVFTSDANIAGSRKGDFASVILQLFPTGTAPFFALSSGMESADASDPIVSWFEESHITGRQVVQTTIVSTIPNLVLDDASSYTPGCILIVEETGEYLYINSINSATCNVVRGFAGTTAQTITATNHVQRIGNAFEEASNRPIGVANLGYPRFNFMQIFRNSWDVSRTAKRTQYHTGDIVSKNKSDCMLLHSEDIERAMWWGKRTMGVQNGKTFRTMDGVLNQLATNVTTASSTTSMDQLNTFLRPIFEKNIKGKPNERIAFCGNTALTVVNKIALLNSTMYIEPGETEFGMKVNKWITPYGDITLMTHPLMVESPYYTADLYVLHPGAVKMRYLDRTTTDNYDSPGTRGGVDGDYGVLTTECSIEYMLEKTGGKLLQLVAGA